MYTGISCRLCTLVSPAGYTHWFLLKSTHAGFSCRVHTLVSPAGYTHWFLLKSIHTVSPATRVYTRVSPAGYTHWFLLQGIHTGFSTPTGRLWKVLSSLSGEIAPLRRPRGNAEGPGVRTPSGAHEIFVRVFPSQKCCADSLSV